MLLNIELHLGTAVNKSSVIHKHIRRKQCLSMHLFFFNSMSMLQWKLIVASFSKIENSNPCNTVYTFTYWWWTITYLLLRFHVFCFILQKFVQWWEKFSFYRIICFLTIKHRKSFCTNHIMQSIKNLFRGKRVHQGSINNNSVCYKSAAVYKFLYQMLISADVY